NATLQHTLAAYNPDNNALEIVNFAAGTVQAGSDPQAMTKVIMTTEYPAEGSIKLHIDRTGQDAPAVKLRLPAWTENYTLAINDTPVDLPATDGWLDLSSYRDEQFTVHLDLDMTPQVYGAHPQVDAIRGTCAVQR